MSESLPPITLAEESFPTSVSGPFFGGVPSDPSFRATFTGFLNVVRSVRLHLLLDDCTTIDHLIDLLAVTHESLSPEEKARRPMPSKAALVDTLATDFPRVVLADGEQGIRDTGAWGMCRDGRDIFIWLGLARLCSQRWLYPNVHSYQAGHLAIITVLHELAHCLLRRFLGPIVTPTKVGATKVWEDGRVTGESGFALEDRICGGALMVVFPKWSPFDLKQLDGFTMSFGSEQYAIPSSLSLQFVDSLEQSALRRFDPVQDNLPLAPLPSTHIAARLDSKGAADIVIPQPPSMLRPAQRSADDYVFITVEGPVLHPTRREA